MALHSFVFWKVLVLIVTVIDRITSDCLRPQTPYYASTSSMRDYYNPGQAITYTCILPYVHVTGSQRCTCQPDQTWDCIRTPLLCGYPAYVHQVFEGVTFGSGFQRPDSLKCLSVTCCLDHCNSDPTCVAVEYRRNPSVTQTSCVYHINANTCKKSTKEPGVILYLLKKPSCEEMDCSFTSGDCVNGICMDIARSFDDCLCFDGYKGGSCTEKVTCESIDVNSGDIRPRKERYDFKETLTVTCDAGYELEGLDGSNEMSTRCQRDGTIQEVPNCIQRKCRVPDDLPLKIISRDVSVFNANDLVRISCREGHKSSDGKVEGFLRCLSNGSFDRPFLNCIPITCPPLENVTNAVPDEQGPFNYSDVVTYSCLHGYKSPTGRAIWKLKCDVNGAINTTDVICLPGGCDVTAISKSVTVESSGKLNNVTLRCPPGETFMNGASVLSVMCTQNGTLPDSVIALKCSDMENIAAHKDGLSPGIVAGIVVGVVLLVSVMVSSIVCCIQRRKRKSETKTPTTESDPAHAHTELKPMIPPVAEVDVTKDLYAKPIKMKKENDNDNKNLNDPSVSKDSKIISYSDQNDNATGSPLGIVLVENDIYESEPRDSVLSEPVVFADNELYGDT